MLAGLSCTQTAITASPIYFCAQLPDRWETCPTRKNHVPIVCESSDSESVRARGVKSRISATTMVARLWVRRAVVGAFRVSVPGTVATEADREGFRNSSSWSPNLRRSLSFRTTGKLTRRLLMNEPFRLPRSTSARSPASFRWIRACSRETERLSSMTAQPSPRPMAHDWPWRSRKRRPPVSRIRYGSGARGFTCFQFSNESSLSGAPVTGMSPNAVLICHPHVAARRRLCLSVWRSGTLVPSNLSENKGCTYW